MNAVNQSSTKPFRIGNRSSTTSVRRRVYQTIRASVTTRVRAPAPPPTFKLPSN